MFISQGYEVIKVSWFQSSHRIESILILCNVHLIHTHMTLAR